MKKITLNGLPITLTDTAGLRETGDIVEKEGIRRAIKEIERADLLLLVYDLSQGEDPLQLAQNYFAEHLEPRRLMLIANKCDLTGTAAEIGNYQGFRHITVSAKQETGVQSLIDAISACGLPARRRYLHCTYPPFRRNETHTGVFGRSA